MRARGRTLALCLLIAVSTAQAKPDAEHARIAEAEEAMARGDYQAAHTKLVPLLKTKRPRALALEGQLLMQRGQRDAARDVFKRLIDLYNADEIKDADAEGMWAVAEAARGLGSYRDANQAFASATRSDPQNLAIELAWVELFLEKYDVANAQTGLARVLSLNPKEPRALERMARVRLEQNAPITEVEALLDQALQNDPRLVAAHVTRAGIALRDEDLALADRHLDAALKLNARDLEALSVRAAVRFLADDNPGFASAIKRVLDENPRFSRMYSIIATYAEWEHRYDDLVRLADEALKLDPDDAYAHATRGLNLLRVGREREGLDALHAAWSRDHYNVHVFNTLNLYDEVISKQYQSFAAPPFQVRVHRKERALLERYAVPLLKRAYEDMATRYAFKPEHPIWIELYANPEHFSVRTSGLPRLGLQGVCFGKVLTALSPSGGEFNWGQILWHELSHVFHVQLSRSRVPRWFTEGLAEYETKRARPEWKREDDRALYDALVREELPTLVNMNHAFTHARSPQDLMVAYYASSVVVEYLVERFGFAKIPELLGLFSQGLGTEEAFGRAFGMSLSTLDHDFRSALRTRLSAKFARDLRIDLSRYRDPKESAKAAQAPNASPSERGAHALALALAGDAANSTSTADAVLRDDPKEPLALFSRAHLALAHGDLQGARKALEAMLAAGHDGYQLRMLLARTEQKLGALPKALDHLTRAEAIDSEREEAYQLAAQIAESLGDTARQRTALLRLSMLDQHTRGPLNRLLPMLSKERDYRTLSERSEAGLYVDPQNPELHRLRAEALASLGDAKAALPEAELALELAPDDEHRRRARLTLEQVRARAREAAAKPTPKPQAKRPISR